MLTPSFSMIIDPPITQASIHPHHCILFIVFIHFSSLYFFIRYPIYITPSIDIALSKQSRSRLISNNPANVNITITAIRIHGFGTLITHQKSILQLNRHSKNQYAPATSIRLWLLLTRERRKYLKLYSCV